MDIAFCQEDGLVWEVADFVELPHKARERLRKSLLCSECEGFAWFRKESRLSPAHFCAHHEETCTYKTYYEDIGDHDDNAIESDDDESSTLIINLHEEKGGELNVQPPRPEKDIEHDSEFSRSTRFIKRRFAGDTPQQSSLRKLLLRLVKSELFRNSSDDVVFYKRENQVFVRGRIRDVVKRFDQINEEDHDRSALYWGPIASVGETQDGRLWLNSSEDYNSASITIFDDIVDDFLDLFDIDDPDELLGAWVIVAGTCIFSGQGEGKPIIWCGTPNYIFVRKYRDQALKAS